MRIYTYPDEKSRCRKCDIHQYFHAGMGRELYLSASCSNYVPSDNLEYLEWKYEQKNKEITI